MPPDPGISDPEIRAEVEGCLALGRETEALVASGDRLAAARRAVELVRTYDKVLEKIRRIPVSAQQQQSVFGRLAPVRELLRKYRLR